MLIEDFKECVHFDIKTHLDERNVDNLHQAATMADDYTLTHKLSFVKKGMENTSFDKNKLGLNKPANFYDPSKGSSTLRSIDKDKSSYNTSGGSSNFYDQQRSIICYSYVCLLQEKRSCRNVGL